MLAATDGNDRIELQFSISHKGVTPGLSRLYLTCVSQRSQVLASKIICCDIFRDGHWQWKRKLELPGNDLLCLGQLTIIQCRQSVFHTIRERMMGGSRRMSGQHVQPAFPETELANGALTETTGWL